MRQVLPSFLRDRRGQAAVELAVLVPVLIAVALVIYNCAAYLTLTAAFDRASFDVVIAKGTSGSPAAATGEIEAQIAEALGAGDTCRVEVAVQEMGTALFREDATFHISPLHARVYCRLHFFPRPRLGSFAGVTLGTPFELVHERILVVDYWKGAVVV